MKKFTKLNESNKTVNTSTNKNDFIKNLIEETLSIDNDEIKGKDILVEAISKIIEINDSKTMISVLENVKAKSFHSFNLNWINEAITTEKNRINNSKIELITETVEEKTVEETVELITETVEGKTETIKEVNEEIFQGDVSELDDVEGIGDIEGIDEIDIKDAGLEVEEEEEECTNCITKDDYEIGDIVYVNLEGPTKAEVTILGDEEIGLAKLDDKDEVLTDDDNQMVFGWKEFNEIVEKEKNDGFVDSVEVEDNMFLDENVNYMSDIDDLAKLMESINSEQINEEHHLETKQERIDFILLNIEKEQVKELVFNLPDYVKTSDIDETLKNLSDNEIENLYLKVEEID